MKVLISILALNEELRESSQRRDRRFLRSGKGLLLFCSHGKVYSVPGNNAARCSWWHLPTAQPKVYFHTRGT